jgi:hypothetical protein
MKTLLLLIALSSPILQARPEFRGPLPKEQQELIHYLAEHHKEFKREVKLTKTGYTATTTTENKELTTKLKTHVAYMEKRLDSGAMVRRWDPAYAEMVEHYDDLDTKITPIKTGLQVTVIGKTPRAIKVARNHANIVTSFTKEGPASVQREHPNTVELDRKAEKAPPADGDDD